MAKQYQLAFTLHGHSGDVRALAAPNPKVPMLLSASRDGSAILWGPSATGNDWDAKLRVEELERRYVSCCTLLRWQGEAYLIIGSASGMLSSYTLPSMTSQPPTIDAPTQSPQHTLVEHTSNLCCIDASKGGLIASGSWDKTAIIWKDFKKAIQIKQHTQAVWAIRFVGEDRVLTASADKTIVLHAIDVAAGKSHPLQSYSGHTDVVRGLSLRPDGKGFWSCGNDGLINLYSFDKAEPERTFNGHTSFVYSIAAFPDGSGAVSSGEDGTLRVWSTTDLVQTIAHPSMSLWSAAVVATPKGSSYYIASASADSTIRFFTNEDDLVAPVTEREAWNNEVSQRQLDKSQVGDVKHSDLPGMEALGRPGKQDGQVIMIKNEGKVEAYQWSSGETTWQQIGQVVDAIGSGRKQLYEGQEYDYVFDVDIADGVPPLKLPYNTSDNPWIAAQKFLEKNELPTTYADQVVEFIEKNTGGVELGAGGGNAYVDPYTGGSRYTGGGVSMGGGSGDGGGGDPLTGGSRYTGGGVPTQGGNNWSDPFTGGSSYSTTPSAPDPVNKVLPVKTILSFKKINAAAAKTKLEQFEQELSASSPGLALDETTKASLAEAFSIVSSDKAPASENYDPKKLLDLALLWDDAHRFPLVDVLRVLALLSPTFGAEASAPASLLAAAGWGGAWSGSKTQSTNTLLALRALANLFNTPTGRKAVVAAAEQGLLKQLVSGRQWSELGTAKQPLATVALNFSILAVTGELPSTLAPALEALVLHILSNETSDSETIYRAAVALGNMLTSPLKNSMSVGGVTKAYELVSARATTLKEQRLTDLAAEIAATAQ